MSKKTILTTAAPAPIGPYSQAIKAGQFLFVSGNIALDPGTGNMVDHSLEAETSQVMLNLEAVLKAAGMNFTHIVKSSIFLTDMDFFQVVNTVYGAYFTLDPPARETIAVAGLPKGARVEISVVAYKE